MQYGTAVFFGDWSLKEDLKHLHLHSFQSCVVVISNTSWTNGYSFWLVSKFSLLLHGTFTQQMCVW